MIVLDLALNVAIGSSVGQSFAPGEDTPAQSGITGTFMAVPVEGGVVATWFGSF